MATEIGLLDNLPFQIWIVQANQNNGGNMQIDQLPVYLSLWKSIS